MRNLCRTISIQGLPSAAPALRRAAPPCGTWKLHAIPAAHKEPKRERWPHPRQAPGRCTRRYPLARRRLRTTTHPRPNLAPPVSLRSPADTTHRIRGWRALTSPATQPARSQKPSASPAPRPGKAPSSLMACPGEILGTCQPAHLRTRLSPRVAKKMHVQAAPSRSSGSFATVSRTGSERSHQRLRPIPKPGIRRPPTKQVEAQSRGHPWLDLSIPAPPPSAPCAHCSSRSIGSPCSAPAPGSHTRGRSCSLCPAR